MSTSDRSPQTEPLAGKRLLLTRSEEQAGETVSRLKEKGAQVLECPTIRLAPVEDWQQIDQAIDRLESYHWLILTSLNGVNFFFNRIRELQVDLQKIRLPRICAVGPKSRDAIERFGCTVSLMPEQLFTGEGVVESFSEGGVAGKRVLFPKAAGARDIIPDRLRHAGAVVDDPVLYRNIIPESIPAEAKQALERGEVDAAIFSSPSTIRNLATLLGGVEQLQRLLKGVAVASIGPVTSRACRELGLVVTVEPQQATFDELINRLGIYFGSLKSQT